MAGAQTASTGDGANLIALPEVYATVFVCSDT